MRKVRIQGKTFDIPDDGEFIVQNEEIVNYPEQVRLTTEYRFPARPHNYVGIRVAKQNMGWRFEEGAVPQALQWEEKDSRPLSEFLVKNEPLFKDDDRFRGMDFDQLENRYNQYLAQKENPCGEVKLPTGRRPSELTKATSAEEYRGRGTPISPDFYKKYYNSPRPKQEWMQNPVKYALEEEYIAEESVRDEIAEIEELINSKGEPVNKPGVFITGDRVIFRSPLSGGAEMATVVGRVNEMKGKVRPGSILLCTDRKSDHHSNFTEYTGEGRGLVISESKARLEGITNGEWYCVPEDVGVFAHSAFQHDGIKFPRGCTGRILGSNTNREMETLRISWNFDHVDMSVEHDEAGKERRNVWEVPASRVKMCLMSKSKGVFSEWPTPGKRRSPFKAEDLVVVPGRSVSCMTKEGREAMLPAGTVAELVDKADRNRVQTWYCRIVGGCQESLIGVKLKIKESYMKLHPEPEKFFKQGQSVEIVAEIDFRKVPLKGMTGKVILSTDQDGDVGIEFPEDIGAGSLDGIGTEGRCIYIEASLVKSSA